MWVFVCISVHAWTEWDSILYKQLFVVLNSVSLCKYIRLIHQLYATLFSLFFFFLLLEFFKCNGCLRSENMCQQNLPMNQLCIYLKEVGVRRRLVVLLHDSECRHLIVMV